MGDEINDNDDDDDDDDDDDMLINLYVSLFKKKIINTEL